LGKKKIRMRMCVLKTKILVTIYSREREMRIHRGRRRCEGDRFPEASPAVPERATIRNIVVNGGSVPKRCRNWRAGRGRFV
jgi:hypothetical protein